MAVGYYDTGVQVIRVSLFGALFVVVPGSKFNFKRLDQFHTARLTDR